MTDFLFYVFGQQNNIYNQQLFFQHKSIQQKMFSKCYYHCIIKLPQTLHVAAGFINPQSDSNQYKSNLFVSFHLKLAHSLYSTTPFQHPIRVSQTNTSISCINSLWSFFLPSWGLESSQWGSSEVLPLRHQEPDHWWPSEDPRGGSERWRPQPPCFPPWGRPGEGGGRWAVST